MATMSLYRYVADRDELELHIVDAVLGQVDTTIPRGSASGRLTVLAERVREIAVAHPAVAPLLLKHRHRSPASLRWAEAVLAVLTHAGISGVDRVLAFRAFLAYVFGAVQAEQLGPLHGAGTAALTELPAETYPLLSATAVAARGVSAEREFRGGLLPLIRGLGI
jgi:hypothetical protein